MLTPGAFVVPTHDDICLWSEPFHVSCGERSPISHLDPRELLLVICIEKVESSRFAMVVSSSSRSVGYVNVMWLKEMAL